MHVRGVSHSMKTQLPICEEKTKEEREKRSHFFKGLPGFQDVFGRGTDWRWMATHLERREQATLIPFSSLQIPRVPEEEKEDHLFPLLSLHPKSQWPWQVPSLMLWLSPRLTGWIGRWELFTLAHVHSVSPAVSSLNYIDLIYAMDTSTAFILQLLIRKECL